MLPRPPVLSSGLRIPTSLSCGECRAGRKLLTAAPPGVFGSTCVCAAAHGGSERESLPTAAWQEPVFSALALGTESCAGTRKPTENLGLWLHRASLGGSANSLPSVCVLAPVGLKSAPLTEPLVQSFPAAAAWVKPHTPALFALLLGLLFLVDLQLLRFTLPRPPGWGFLPGPTSCTGCLLPWFRLTPSRRSLPVLRSSPWPCARTATTCSRLAALCRLSGTLWWLRSASPGA